MEKELAAVRAYHSLRIDIFTDEIWQLACSHRYNEPSPSYSKGKMVCCQLREADHK